MLPGMLMTGVGVGLTLPTLVSAAVSAVPPHRFSTGSGVVTMARQLGIVLGVALLITVLGTPAPHAALAAFGRGYVLTAGLAASAAVASLLLVLSRRKAATASSASASGAGAVPAVLTDIDSAAS